MPTFIPARGRTLHLAGACVNRIGKVTPYYKSKMAVDSYDVAERPEIASGIEANNIVLVEVDKMDNLRTAFPNYFGDVRLFTHNLKAVVCGGDIREHTVVPQERVPWRATNG